MPVHNRFILVDEAVASVYDQTYRPIELIIVDDLSDELYMPKISSEPDFEVKIIRHEENKGPGASREMGRMAAHGDYIAYLDSDDLWNPEKLEKQVAMLRAHPEAGMCYCKINDFSSLPLVGNEPISQRSGECFSAFLPTLFFGRPWGTSACLWTRDATDRIGPWVNAWAWEDYAYDCRAGCLDIGIAYIPEVLCFTRRDQQIDQLSSRGFFKSIVNKVPALLAISEDLLESGKISNIETRKKFLETLRNNASTLLTYGEIESSNLLLNELLKHLKKFTFPWLIIFLTVNVFNFVNYSAINRIKGRIIKNIQTK